MVKEKYARLVIGVEWHAFPFFSRPLCWDADFGEYSFWRRVHGDGGVDDDGYFGQRGLIDKWAGEGFGGGDNEGRD